METQKKRAFTTFHVVVQVDCEVAHNTLSLREIFKGKMHSLRSPLKTSLSACSHSASEKGNCLDVIATTSATVKGKSGTADRSLVEDKERPLTVSANPNTNPQGSGLVKPDPLPNGE